MTKQRALIVGASLAGLRAAEGLRREGFNDEIVIVGSELHAPYNRPPLTKTATAPDLTTLTFRMPRNLGDVSWRLGETVTSIDLDGFADLDGGERLEWDGLVCATGLRPRRIPSDADPNRRHVVRTFEDAHRLMRDLAAYHRVVIVGAGFLGMEVAALAATMGKDVLVIAPEPEPLFRVAGPLVGATVRRRHEARGVRFKLGRLVSTLTSERGHYSIGLDDGTGVEAEVIVEAMGGIPEVDYLNETELDISNGVLCGADLVAINAANVVACGDIARWPNTRIDEVPRRVEQWTVAGESGRAAGSNLARRFSGQSTQHFTPLSTFWSDQYDFRLQGFGMPHLGDDAQLLQGDIDGEFAVAYRYNGEVMGIVMVGLASQMAEYRALVAHGALLERRPSPPAPRSSNSPRETERSVTGS